MTIFEATMIAEGNPEIVGIDPEELTEEKQLEAWQMLVDTGTCWRLQGWFGRTAAALIANGMIEARA